MSSNKMKNKLTVWERAEMAAKLSAIAYMDEESANNACKRLGFAHGLMMLWQI